MFLLLAVSLLLLGRLVQLVLRLSPLFVQFWLVLRVLLLFFQVLLILRLFLLLSLFLLLGVRLLLLGFLVSSPRFLFPFLGALVQALGVLPPRLVVQFPLSTAVSTTTPFSGLLVAGPLATVLLGLLLALPTSLSLHSASLLGPVLPLLNVLLVLVTVLLTLVTVTLTLVALLPGLAGTLSGLRLTLLGTALSARPLVPRRECLVTGGLPAPSLVPSLPAAGAALQPGLSLELLLVLRVIRLWILPSLVGRLLATELWTLPAPGLGRRLALVSLRLSTTGGLILLSPRRRPRLALPALRSPVPLRAFRPLWRLLSLRRLLTLWRLLVRRLLVAP